jgi:hypothetical protein
MAKLYIPARLAKPGTSSFPVPKPLGDMLWFERLSADSSVALRGAMTLGWYIKDVPDDPWTTRFLQFKNAWPNAIKGAQLVLARELANIEWGAASSIGITSAMGSRDTTYNASEPAAQLATFLAKQFGFRDLNGLFAKKAHKSLHKLKGGAAEREAEVAGAYKVVGQIGVPVVLICDDVITAGSTLGDMARAISAKNPKVEVIGLALGKAERRAWAAGSQYALTNDHIPAKSAHDWDRAK